MNTPSQSQQSLEFDFHTNRPWRRSLVRSFKRWMAWRREQRRTLHDINDLLELNDHLLADIGLTRDRIVAARAGTEPEGVRQ